MTERPEKYVAAVFRSWGRSISGPVFGILSLLLLVLQQVITDAPVASAALKWGSRATIGIAVLFVVIAQYQVWRDEHERRRAAEDELQSSADIRGIVWVQLSAVNPNADQARAASALGYTFDCSNHGKVACELNKVVIKIKPPSGYGFNLLQDLQSPHVVEHGRAFKYESTCGVQGVSPEDLRKSEICVFVVDSLGKEYHNTQTRITNMVLKVVPRGNAQPDSDSFR